MSKEKSNVNNFFLWCFIISTIVSSLIVDIHQKEKIIKIEETIKDMPIRECHTEEQLEKIILEPYDYGVSNYGYEYNPEDMIICDEGVEDWKRTVTKRRVINFNENVSKECVIYSKREVCEII